MIKGYSQVNLFDMIKQLGEDRTQSILSDFSCPLNKDVEDFLRSTSVEFAKQRIAATHLVFASYKNSQVLIGYFTLASKAIVVYKSGLSNRLQKRISKFAQYDTNLKRYTLSAPLIAQLGKNFANDYNALITGDELLLMACKKVEKIQLDLGGKLVYLECENKPQLIDFYSGNGFINFGQRKLEGNEVSFFEGEYLVQMLKYLS